MNPEEAQSLEAAIQKTLSTHAKSDKSYLWMAYQVIFEREADPEGIAMFLNQLKEGWTRPTLIAKMIESNEFQHRLPAGTQSFASTESQVLIELENFKIYAMTNDTAVGQTIISTRSYEPHVTDAIVKHLKSGDVFLDLGANIGYFTLLAASIVKNEGKVISFEPNQYNRQLLYASIVENQFKNITVYPFAVSDSQQIFRLMTSGSNGWVVELSEESVNYQLVQSVVLDELLQSEKEINVIKMDIEGHEPIALRGMERIINKHRPIIFTEFHPYAVGEGYLKQLTQYNYRLFIIEEVGKITEAPDTTFVMDFWQRLAEKVNFDRIHLDLMALPS
ncbi:FkbM family methyltransferase [Microcoleus sp.]|uniref:FkbM family methyltransferase n=1 Tax=Microcoleus sp. TaxID=44472 RepID=UPI003526ABDF